jgi:hypothetical protein
VSDVAGIARGCFFMLLNIRLFNILLPFQLLDAGILDMHLF